MQDGPAQLLRKTLKLVKIFENLSESEAASFLRVARRLDVSPDELVVREGQRGDDAYIIVRGHLRVIKRHAGEDVELARMHPGDAFGELAIIDDGPRSATVIADTEATLLRFNRDSLALQPAILIKVLTNIARLMATRLRDANHRVLSASLYQRENTDHPDLSLAGEPEE